MKTLFWWVVATAVWINVLVIPALKSALVSAEVSLPKMSQEASVVFQAIIAAVVTITLAYMSNRTAVMVRKTADEAAEKSAEAAKKVVEVKTTLDDTNVTTGAKLDAIAEVGEKTHDTVNHLALIQLKLLGATQRRFADLTKDPKDVALAEGTEALIVEHEKAEIIVQEKALEKLKAKV